MTEFALGGPASAMGVIPTALGVPPTSGAMACSKPAEERCGSDCRFWKVPVFSFYIILFLQEDT